MRETRRRGSIDRSLHYTPPPPRHSVVQVAIGTIFSSHASFGPFAGDSHHCYQLAWHLKVVLTIRCNPLLPVTVFVGPRR